MKKILFTFLILTGIASAQITFPSGFDIASPEPIDVRFSVADITARNAIANLYDGLLVFVQSDSVVYYYHNGAWNPVQSNLAASTADSITTHRTALNTHTGQISVLDTGKVGTTGIESIWGVKNFQDSVHFAKVSIDSLTIVATDTMYTPADSTIDFSHLVKAVFQGRTVPDNLDTLDLTAYGFTANPTILPYYDNAWQFKVESLSTTQAIIRPIAGYGTTYSFMIMRN